MPRVICDLPNASDEISGVKFTPLEDGRMISDEISDEAAHAFASITGYTLDLEEDENHQPAAPVKPPAPTLTKAQQKAAEKKALAEKAAAAAAEEKARQEQAAADQKALDDQAAAAAAAAAGNNGEQPNTENPEVF